MRKDQIKFRLHAEVEHHFSYNIYFDPAEKFPHQKPQTGYVADFDYPFDPDPTK